MKFRTYNEQNTCDRTNRVYPTYFRTKREAMEYAEKIGGNAVVEKKIGGNWYKAQSLYQPYKKKGTNEL